MGKNRADVIACEINYLKDCRPDVFYYVDGVGYVQAWKSGDVYHLECKGVKGEYYQGKFTGVDKMEATCESYFSALRAGYPLWEV